MSNGEIMPYNSPNSTFNLEELPSPVKPSSENSYVLEEVNAITMAPLSIMPPPHNKASGGASIYSTARSKAPQDGAQPRCPPPPSKSAPKADKGKTSLSAGTSSNIRVTPSSNTVYSTSYTVVGIQKPDGGCGKGLMRKLSRGKGSAIPVQKAISKGTTDSFSQPLRFMRKNKPTLKPCAILEEDEEPTPPKDPQIISLKNMVTDLCEEIIILKA
jgi:hypothetical protein